jgi:hypothetical protein
VALTLAMFVFGPALDAVTCQGDNTSAAVVVESGGQTAVSQDGAPDYSASQGHETCPHGHCHHGGEVVAVALAETPVIAAKMNPPVALASLALATQAPRGLERPPRV